MTWKQALEETLEHWYGIRDSIGLVADLDLLIAVHEVCPVCEKAAEVAGDPVRRCDFCPVAGRFGSCYPIGGQMSERIAEHDLEGLAELVDEFIARLEAAIPPPERDVPWNEEELAHYVEML
jgi:hypothetical protein